MTSKKDMALYALLGRSQQLAEEFLEYAQNRVSPSRDPTPEQMAVVKGALAISFTTLSKATGVSMHDCVDMVMTIYKNTEVVESEDD